MRPHDDLEVKAALKHLFDREMDIVTLRQVAPRRSGSSHLLTWPTLGLALLLIVGLAVVRLMPNLPGVALDGGALGSASATSSHPSESTGMAAGSSTPPTSPTPKTSLLATPPPSTEPSIGPIVDGLPTTIDGRAVLLMPAAVKDLVASTSDRSFLVGGWFHAPAPVWWCPAQGYDSPWGTCLRFAVYEGPNGGIGDILGKPVWLYGKPPTETILVYPGNSLTLDETQPYSATRPVVIAVHTHDPACAAGQIILTEPCSSQVVLYEIVWVGSAVK